MSPHKIVVIVVVVVVGVEISKVLLTKCMYLTRYHGSG